MMVKAKTEKQKMMIEKILDRYNLPETFEVSQEEYQKVKGMVYCLAVRPGAPERKQDEC